MGSNAMKINVLEYLQKTVAEVPDKVGFEDANASLTFVELNKLAQNISSNICLKVKDIKKPVAVFLPKSVDMIVSFMGILYSGNIYMPLDIKNPEERLKAIFDNIRPALVITNKNNYSKISEISTKCEVVLIEDFSRQVENITTRYEELIDTDGAYIINTSGSTGKPKGVLISHRSIIDYIEWATNEYKITSEEIIGNQAPFYFDNSVLDIYLTIKNGCKLILTPENLFIFPIKLMEYFQKMRVNMFFFVPSILVSIANMDILKTCKPMFNKILFAGDVMPTKQLNYWIKHYPDAIFSNLYGPTEITVDCTYYTVDRELRDDEPLPIGRRCRNSDVFLLNEKDEEVVDANVSGELCVRGTSLALGYYNDFEKTQKVFTQNPLNTHYPEMIYRTGDIVYYNEKGEIIFKGRKDFQIKHMGYRIELGEIETALGKIKELKNVCVVYDQVRSKIVLFYEAETDITSKDLISMLGKNLPKYMIPTDLRKVDRLPLNRNGKIDRLALKQKVNEG